MSLSATFTSPCNQYVLLATAQVQVKSSSGEPIVAKALLDNGSQMSFITESLLKELGFEPCQQSINVSGICQKDQVINRVIDLHLVSIHPPFSTFTTTVAVVDQITYQLPQIFLNSKIL